MTDFAYEPALARLDATLTELYRSRAGAHDAVHVQRVKRAATIIALEENAALRVVIPAAMLHELVNPPKNHPDASRAGELCADAATELLTTQQWPAELIGWIALAIREHAFSRAIPPSTLESAVLQDADRLDAIGAVGIARCFATCGEMGGVLYHPEDPLCRAREPDDKRYAVDHFVRKLLKIEEKMNTGAGRRLARKRTEIIERFMLDLAQEV